MGKLAEYLKTEATAIREAKAKSRAAVKEWTDAVDALVAKLQGWLAACDPEGLLDSAVETIPGTDPALGEHQVHALRISLGDRTVRATPRARYVAATVRLESEIKPFRAQGLVELRDSAGVSYYLFRRDGDRWYIQKDTASLKVADNLAELLDQEKFEAALWTLLR